jgi:DNA mismatch repair protein MutS
MGSIYNEYISYHERYEKKYGKNRVIILMQVGSFHEAYATNEKGPNLYAISDLLNIVCTRKDKSIDVISDKNPYMLGFPSVALQKFMKILIDNKYTVIVIDQTTPPPNPTREVTGIYSPSTYIETVNPLDNKCLMTILIETHGKSMSIGMNCIDISTGYVNYYETHGVGLIEENDALNECQRYYHFFRPVELIIYVLSTTHTTHTTSTTSTTPSTSTSLEAIVNKLDILPEQVLFTYTSINNAFTKITYQNNVFDKVYALTPTPNPKAKTVSITPIEKLNLEKYPYATISLVISFDYLHQHNNKLINNIQHPEYFNNCNYMILGNNAQYQLNVIDYYNYELANYKTKFNSLNDVINCCITAMGKRNLKSRLCAPYTDRNTITALYDLTEKMLSIDFNTIRKYLVEISDLERLFRKISISHIQPYELFQIYTSFTSIVNIIQLLLKTNMKDDIFKMFTKKHINLFNNAISYIEETFSIDKLKKNNMVEIKENIYNEGIYPVIDTIINKIDNGINFMDKLASKLSSYLPASFPKSKNGAGEGSGGLGGEAGGLGGEAGGVISVKHNDRDGYYLLTTKIRGNKLREALEKEVYVYITDTETINAKDIKITTLNNTVKITYDGLNTQSDEMDNLYIDLDKIVKENFIRDVKNFYNNYAPTFTALIKLIMQIDMISNNAHISKKYHYTKPVIREDMGHGGHGGSYINAKNLRHPIIEQIIDYEYVPHDIILNNNDKKGILIYGVNSCGKSSLMKAVGLNIIMAQCGLYVPSEHFEYDIFTSLYTRISGNDNLFKGQSSFIVEMNELRTILKKCNNFSLVLGDEICRGTEYLSGNAIVGASIIKLCNMSTKFLFATHLHDLPNLNKIKEMNTIKFYHLSVEQKGGELVFNRKLEEGTGEQIYGITIAKYILDDPEFINTAIELKNKLLDNKRKGENVPTYKLVNDKVSTYNKDVYVDKCYMCSSVEKLETHHLIHQKDFNDTINGLICAQKMHIQKDGKANLVVLCRKCHDIVHAH